MINITPDALKRLSEFLIDKKASLSVRIHQTAESCGGDGFLVLSVDLPNEQDFTVKAGDLTLMIQRTLMAITGDVTIDFKNNGLDSGFVVETQKILPVRDMDCGGCTGCFRG
jgi:Fe-S cluster assembly iron-binding protein IscA